MVENINNSIFRIGIPEEPHLQKKDIRALSSQTKVYLGSGFFKFSQISSKNVPLKFLTVMYQKKRYIVHLFLYYFKDTDFLFKDKILRKKILIKK